MKRWPLLAAAAAVLLAAPAAGVIAFEEIAQQSGLIFTTDSCPTPNKNQPETMVAGVALLDYDNDGYLDVYLVNGAAIPSLKKDSPKYWNRLFHNNHDGTFTDVTEKAGVAGEGYGMGVAVGDFDNDGWPDLYVANVTGNQLFRNNHNGTFSDVTNHARVGGGMLDGKKMWSVSAVWLDYNNDGLLDLFVSNYCKWEVNKDPVCRPNPTTRSYCHPKNYQPLPNTLYRNNGDGTFTDVSAETGIGKHFGKGMGAVIADYDGDGFMDIFVPNDNMPNFLFHNIGGKKFEEVALESGVAYPQSANAISSMGADFKDVFNDGKPDIWHTATENESFPLYRNRGGGDFVEVTDQSMLGGTRNMSGWSNGIFDFDNDGWKDLFVARGNVLDNVALVSNRTYGEQNAVFRNLGSGKFRDVSAEAGAGFQESAPHRGAAFGDLDNDGLIDAVVTVLNHPVKYFHNVTANANHWILLKLVGTKSNRMGIGAQIRITTENGLKQYNQVTTACGFAGASDSRVHFGLGASKTIREIDIKWPSRIHQVLRDVPADRILTIQEQ
jgi:hypothetical protein